MKEMLFSARDGMKTVVGLAGLSLAVSRLTNDRKVLILCYHNPHPSLFAGHAAWLTRHYNPISFDLFFKAIKENDRSILPARSVVITIDDGWKQNVDLIPVLVKHNLSVLIYLTAGIIGTSRKFWWLAVREAAGDVALLKRLPVNEFLEALKDSFNYEPEKEYPERCAMTWDEVYRLRKTGLVTFGAHTVTHPILTKCPSDFAWKEIVESKHMLERNLDQPVVHFSYPDGGYSQREKEMLRVAGYVTGRTVRTGWVDFDKGVDLLDLPVIGEPDNDNVPQLSYAIAGLYFLRKNLVDRIKLGPK